jgi:hypothetical protein
MITAGAIAIVAVYTAVVVYAFLAKLVVIFALDEVAAAVVAVVAVAALLEVIANTITMTPF